MKTIYEANDGSRFHTKEECLEYEGNKDIYPLTYELSKMEIKELRNIRPLLSHNVIDPGYSDTFYWFKVENNKDFKALTNMIGTNWTKPKLPDLICVWTRPPTEHERFDIRNVYCLREIKKNMIGFAQAVKSHDPETNLFII